MTEWFLDRLFEVASAVFTWVFVTLPRWWRRLRDLREERLSEQWRTEQRRFKL